MKVKIQKAFSRLGWIDVVMWGQMIITVILMS